MKKIMIVIMLSAGLIFIAESFSPKVEMAFGGLGKKIKDRDEKMKEV